MADTATFEGFPVAALDFYDDLEMDNTKSFWTAHKQVYEESVKAPMAALLAELEPDFGPAKLFRPYRDVRFAKDKTPYKTHIGAVITVAGKAVGEGGNAAMYLHFGLDEEFVGVGCYRFDAGKLASWRKAVAGKPGAELASLVARLRKAGYEVGGHDDYKKVPAGFAADHPRAELLKSKGLTGGCAEIPRGLIHKPGFAGWLVKHGKAMAPLVIWLHRHVR